MTEKRFVPGASGPSIADAPLRLTTVYEVKRFLPHTNDEMFAAEDLLGSDQDGGVMRKLHATHEHSRRRGDRNPAAAVNAAVKRYIGHYRGSAEVVRSSRLFNNDLDALRPDLVIADVPELSGKSGARIAIHHRDLEMRRDGEFDVDKHEGLDPLTHDYLPLRRHPLVLDYMNQQLASLSIFDARKISTRAAVSNIARNEFWGEQLEVIADKSHTINGRLAARALEKRSRQ